jgi:signal peptidase I
VTKNPDLRGGLVIARFSLSEFDSAMAKPSKTEKPADVADKSTPSKNKTQDDKRPARSDGTRETIESVVVAFILAFLVRTFEAEAFVIPTGSMAPTLYGRHIDFTCPECGTHSVVGASSELDRNTEYYVPSQRITSALCPNCRYNNQIFDAATRPDGLPGFKGDRILVNKFPYEFWEPERWDIVVFKFPEDPKTNYIKRLVGLPGEEIKIEWGDIFTRKGETEPFRVAHKDDPNKQRVLQLLVHDNEKPARGLIKKGWPERWAALKSDAPDGSRWSSDADGWEADYQARTFQIDGAGSDEERWIRYRHFVPSQDDWDAYAAERPLTTDRGPMLISDFCPYNAYTQRGGRASGRDDAFWVSDLTINFDVEIEKAEGELQIELTDGDYRHRCRFDLKTGKATLYYIETGMKRDPPYEERQLATAQTNLQGSGKHSISFANVDQRLCLWIDDSLVEFDGNTEYPLPAHPGPGDVDLAPVGIAANGCQLKVSGLLLQRDVYYRSDAETENGKQYEYGGSTSNAYDNENNYLKLRDLLYDPQAWFEEFESKRAVANFDALSPDEFFMMGDNSPHSLDGRLWPNTRGAKNRHAVPRSALVGKAFFVYWPHGIPFMNGGRGYGIPGPLKWLSYHRSGPGEYPEQRNPPEAPYTKFTVPFYPNVFRMHRIR